MFLETAGRKFFAFKAFGVVAAAIDRVLSQDPFPRMILNAWDLLNQNFQLAHDLEKPVEASA